MAQWVGDTVTVNCFEAITSSGDVGKRFGIHSERSYLVYIRSESSPSVFGKFKRSLFLALCFLFLQSPGAAARTVPDPTDSSQFFATVADKLLRSTFNFGVTNIPVQSNGVFVYTPAMQRLLQVAANVLDASNTNFYPTVFRPIFYRDGQGDVFIAGFQQVSSVTGISDLQLAQPVDVSNLPAGRSTNNVYGVPWIIGAKKGFPNFEQFTVRNDVQLTRKLQVTRDSVVWYNAATAAHFHTNVMYVLGISNHMGFAFWNSYSSNYVSPTGANISIAVYDNVEMWLTNANMTIRFAATNFAYTPATFTNWPGSDWDNSMAPNNRYASPYAFMGGVFHFPFLPESAYVASTMSFVPTADNPQFETNIVPRLYSLPQFGLVTSNRLQAFIVDGSHVIDYVHFSGPSSERDLNGEIAEKYYNGINTPPYRQWITNFSGSPTGGVNQGLLNQILVSRIGPNVAPNGNKWVTPPNMPSGVSGPAAMAAYFNGFFTPTWTYGVKVYTNTATSLQAPYTPTRTAYQYTVWQANDPLVHYLVSDLNLDTYYTGLNWSDDPITQPLPAFNLGSEGEHYQPWGREGYLNSLVNVDPNPYNAAIRDPLVWGSDDWNFPTTNQLALETLSRIHRGTPWQTIFLKATNILEYVDAAQLNPAVGQQTWARWTGNSDTNDAALMSPLRDWQLTTLIASLLNTNDATQLTSINTTNWPATLDGIVAQTNFTAFPYYENAPDINSVVMVENSPQATAIASALAMLKSNQPVQQFNSVAAILAAPELSIASPWLNLNDAVNTEDRIRFDISDEAYEAIPSQLLPRLRPDSFGEMHSTNGGFIASFTGADGFDYAIQSSTNLTGWQTLSTNQATQGILIFPAIHGYESSRRFYRSILLP